MAFVDYVIKHTDNPEELARRILYSIYIRQIKGDKPTPTLIIAPSGEGKSEGALRLLEVLLEIQGVELTDDFLNVANIFTPLEFSDKVHKILFDKNYKKLNIVILHEADEIVGSTNWQDFIPKAVANINNKSRTIKPLIVIIVSQHLSKIARSTRVSCKYYVEAHRSIGKHTKFYFHTIWEKKHGIEKSELMPRKMSGFLVNEQGKYRRHYLESFEMTRATKEHRETFRRMDTEAKGIILDQQLKEIMKKIKREVGDYGQKITSMVDWYSKDTNKIETIGKRYRGKWKVKEEIIKAHDLSHEEARIFEDKLSEKLNSMGYFSKEEPQDEKIVQVDQ